jgi:hypothetical protein
VRVVQVLAVHVLLLVWLLRAASTASVRSGSTLEVFQYVFCARRYKEVELVDAAERAGLDASARSIREAADGFGAV